MDWVQTVTAIKWLIKISFHFGVLSVRKIGIIENANGMRRMAENVVAMAAVMRLPPLANSSTSTTCPGIANMKMVMPRASSNGRSSELTKAPKAKKVTMRTRPGGDSAVMAPVTKGCLAGF